MHVELFGADDVRLGPALEVRRTVFIREQGVPEEIEIDEHDVEGSAAIHALVRADGAKVVAAGRMHGIDAQHVKIGRMAVLAAWRGSGIGRLLLDELLAEAQRRGFSIATLHAQEHAVEFYRKAGFVCVGERFIEAAIVHQAMERGLY